MSKHEQLVQSFDEAEQSATQASRGLTKDRMVSRSGNRSAGKGPFGTIKTELTDNDGAKVSRNMHWSNRGWSSTSTGYEANLPTNDGKTQYEATKIRDPGSGREGYVAGITSIKRYDADGNEVYTHESTDPTLAHQVGVVAVKRITQKAKDRTGEKLAA